MFIFSEHLRPIVASSLMLCLLCLIYADHASCAQVSAEGTRSIYLDNTGIIWEWGDGKWTPRPFLANAKAVQSSPFSTLALRKNGEVWIWGSSKWEKSGQLKNARKYLPPHKILDNTIYISAGEDRWFAIRTDGSLWGWGMLNYGMGLKFKIDSAGKNQETPGILPHEILFSEVLEVSSGVWTTLALTKQPHIEGAAGDAVTFMGWGRNDCGEMGDYDEKESMTPQKVYIKELDGKPLRKIFIAGYNVLALTDAGEVWNWGDYTYNCEGTWPENLAPRKLEGISNITDISGSRWASGMLQSDGTLWGTGTVQVGKDSWISVNRGEVIKILSNVQSFAFGEDHLLIIKSDGTLWGLGSNKKGQLGKVPGDKPYEWYSEPVQIIMPPLESTDMSQFVQ